MGKITTEINGMGTKKRIIRLGKEAQSRFNGNTFEKRSLSPQIVHKLNNSLAIMIGYAQLSLNRTTDPEVKRQLEEIINEAQKASQIIKDIVFLKKKEGAKKEIQDINVLVEAVLEEKMQALNSKNINVLKQLSMDIPLTYLNSNQIQKILLSLINNAEKVISESGKMGEIKVSTYKIEDQIEIIVSHNGQVTDGMEIEQELGGIYDILTEHGGTLRQESERGKGETFILTLPITVWDHKKRVDGEKTKKDLKGMKGLVIDDDNNIVNMTSKFLEEQGCEISSANDMKVAIGILEALSPLEEFDFIICDIKMPEISGIDFYEIIQKRWPTLKDRIIFSTGDILSDQTRRFINSISNPCLEKPFTLTELKEAINRL